MDSNSFKPLSFKRIDTSVDEAKAYINDRRLGNIKSLKTRWRKFNNLCMGGLTPDSLVTIAGMSSSGKTAFANILETDIFDLNPDIDFVVLNFSLEMKSEKQIARKVSSRLKKTVSELYSGTDDNKITDEEYEKIVSTANRFKKYDIYYIESSCNIEGIRNSIRYFQETYAKDKWLVVILDHTLLVDGNNSEDDRTMLEKLEKMFIEVKKLGRTTIIQLTQLNRNIEQIERIKNPAMHYPIRSDISSGDTIYHASDYLLVIHRPDLLGIQQYGPYKLPVENLVYTHLLKNRDGGLGVLQFQNELKYNSLIEL